MIEEGLNSVVGVDIMLLGENNYNCRYCLLKRKGSSLEIESQKSITGTLVQVLEALPKTYPMALNVSGKGILVKNIELQQQHTFEQLSAAAFPGVALKDFYLQVFEGEANALIHIIRKTMVNPVLDTFRTAGFKIFALSLGAAVSSQIWSLLNIYGNVVSFEGHQFTLSENKSFTDYRFSPELKNKFPLKIEQQVLAEEYVLAYAAAFQLILHDKLSLLVADATPVNQAFQSYLEDAKLKKKAFIFLAGLFFSLLISFLVFSHYNTENAALAGRVGAEAASAEQTDLLKKGIAEDELLLKVLNWNGGYNYGFILNEIGSSCPKQLSLSEVTLNAGKKMPDNPDSKNGILISGYTGNLSAVNNWLFVLKEKKWIKTVRLLNYKPDSESDNYRFNLLITY